MAPTDTSDLPANRMTDPGHQLPAAGDGREEAMGDGDHGRTGVGQLIRDLAEDTRTLVQQEIELAKLEVTNGVKRVVKDSAWIGAGAVIVLVGGLCLVVALALGLGALLGSYWLGTLITGLVLLIAGALVAWKGIGDLKKGGLLPTGSVESLQEDKSWAQKEVEDFRQGFTEERA
jgi:hypothetical protein